VVFAWAVFAWAGRWNARPAFALAEKRSVVIITAPVIVEGKADHRDADTVTVIIERDRTALIRIAEKSRVEPAAIALYRHVAPAITIEAAIDGDGLAGIEIDDGRIIGSGAG
jgi:hypothetical protein